MEGDDDVQFPILVCAGLARPAQSRLQEEFKLLSIGACASSGCWRCAHKVDTAAVSTFWHVAGTLPQTDLQASKHASALRVATWHRDALPYRVCLIETYDVIQSCRFICWVLAAMGALRTDVS
jgi:hypothetical protein